MEFNYDAAVEVGFAEDLTYKEVAPLLDELARTSIFRVSGSRAGWSGPAGGGPEVGIVLAAVATVGGAAFAKSFCEELGKDAYRAVRAALISIVDRLRERDPERVRAVVPLEIKVGGLSICIGASLQEPDHSPDEWTEEWLLRKLAEAQAVVDSGPPSSRESADDPVGPSGPCDHWLT